MASFQCEEKQMMSIVAWWHRHFTVTGQDAAWRERYARQHGYAYPGHVPPQPMAPAAASAAAMEWPHVNVAPPKVLRMGPRPSAHDKRFNPIREAAEPIPLAEREARFERGMQVIHQLSPKCLAMLAEDGRILSEAAAGAKAAPPRPRHHGMIVVAGETILLGRLIWLDLCADGSYIARARRLRR
jgi:hypothetical protein